MKKNLLNSKVQQLLAPSIYMLKRKIQARQVARHFIVIAVLFGIASGISPASGQILPGASTSAKRPGKIHAAGMEKEPNLPNLPHYSGRYLKFLGGMTSWGLTRGRSYQLRYETGETPDQVLQWYESALKGQGYTTADRASSRLLANNPDLGASVFIMVAKSGQPGFNPAYKCHFMIRYIEQGPTRMAKLGQGTIGNQNTPADVNRHEGKVKAMRRSEKGSIIVIILTVLVTATVLIGTGIFFLLQMFAGGRQTESASDAGSLNVAKVAMLAPSVQLNPNSTLQPNPAVTVNGQSITYGSIDATISAIVLKGNTSVNLLNFNKIVAWALVTAANAQADGNTDGINLSHAIWQRVEGDTRNSIGAQLNATLSAGSSASPGTAYTVLTGNGGDVPTGNWPQSVFDQVAHANATTLANSDQQVNWQSFDVGYIGVGDSSNVPVNVIQNKLPQLNLPQVNGYIQGYVPITIPNSVAYSDNYYFLTVYKDQNPGLRSNIENAASKIQPGSGGKYPVALPPNTFVNHANITFKGTNSLLAVNSPATVGAKQYPAVDLHSGYIVLDNTPAGTYAGYVVANCQHVTCNQLCSGIFVFSDVNGNAQLFSLDNAKDSDMANIISWVNAGKTGPAPALEGVYNYSDGSQATIASLKNLTANLAPIAMAQQCNDYNTDTTDGASVPVCQKAFNAFQAAYYPNGTAGALQTPPVTGLIAAEIAKDACASNWTYMELYPQVAGSQYTATYNGAPSSNFTHGDTHSLTTGLAQYWADANPITDALDKSIGWGTSGTGVFVSSSSGEQGLGQFGEEPGCCAGVDWVDSTRLGKITKRLTLGDPAGGTEDIIDQTTINAFTGNWPKNSYKYWVDTTINGTNTSATVKQDPGAGNRPSNSMFAYFSHQCQLMGANLGTPNDPPGTGTIYDVWNNTQIDVGEVWYVSVNSQGKLVASQQSPANVTGLLSSPGGGVDGTIYRYYTKYNILFNVVDATYDFNVHDRQFTQVCNTGGALVATDSVYLEQGSGALGGCYGRIHFNQLVNNGPGPGPMLEQIAQGSSDLEVLNITTGNVAPVMCYPN